MAKAIDLGGISESLNDKADLDWNNCEIPPLTETQISNCLLENPKLVDYDYNTDGSILIKSGSQFIVPYGTSAPQLNIGETLNGGVISDISWNGSKLFYYVKINEDKQLKSYATITNRWCLLLNNGEIYGIAGVEQPSGTSPDTSGIYYHTTENIVYQDGIAKYHSFPFMSAINSSETTFSSITNEFNSIGYIGSTSWGSKGVKGLVPNGRNPDGTLKSEEILFTNVVVHTTSTAYSGNIGLRNSSIVASSYTGYDEVKNIAYNQNDGSKQDYAWIGKFTKGTYGVFTNFELEQPFKAVDNNDFQTFKQEITDTTLNTNQITNCLLENPQLVNVEINNGTLSLKSGSTVIVPYGTNAPTMKIGDSLNNGTITDISWDGSKLFYYVRYDSDISDTSYLTTVSFITSVGPNKFLTASVQSVSFSGTDSTMPTTSWTSYYNTEQNIVYYKSESTVYPYVSLPFGVFYREKDVGYTKIINLFDSIGYIGTTGWIGKGVKGLIPNGRNNDGTLRNTIYTQNNIFTYDLAISTEFQQFYIVIGTNGFYRNCSVRQHFEQETKPLGVETLYATWYNPQTNYMYYKNTANEWFKMNAFFIGSECFNTKNVITAFNVKKPFQVLDKSDTQYIANQAMPSGKYIDYSVSTTSQTYIAPADGWLYAEIRSPANSYNHLSGFIYDENNVSIYAYIVVNEGKGGVSSNWGKFNILPIKKGFSFSGVRYTTSGTYVLRFIYANGVL